MKRPLVWILVIGLVALDWVALHDIAKGGEDLLAEYIVVAVSVVVLARLLEMEYRRRRARRSADEGGTKA
jgi:hypothetical protein